MSETLTFCAFLALLNVAVYILLRKWDLLEFLQYYVPQWVFPTRCEFCLFHRLAFVEVLLIEIRHGIGWGDWDSLLFYPLAAAVLGVFFLRRE